LKLDDLDCSMLFFKSYEIMCLKLNLLCIEVVLTNTIKKERMKQ